MNLTKHWKTKKGVVCHREKSKEDYQKKHLDQWGMSRINNAQQQHATNHPKSWELRNPHSETPWNNQNRSQKGLGWLLGEFEQVCGRTTSKWCLMLSRASECDLVQRVSGRTSRQLEWCISVGLPENDQRRECCWRRRDIKASLELKCSEGGTDQNWNMAWKFAAEHGRSGLGFSQRWVLTDHTGFII